MKNKFLLSFIVAFLLLTSLYAQSPKDSLILVTYNVENFFHPDDDPATNDNEFTPNGTYMWTNSRAIRKAVKIARVINSIAEASHYPDIIGFCEIEGSEAANILLSYGKLKDRGYRLVNLDTRDGRGIATVIIYRHDRLCLVDSTTIDCNVPSEDFNTRKILHCTFTHGRDTLHVLENHWPSRSGGVAKSAWRRNHVATMLKNYCDSILALSADAKIVIMGDLNETADSEEIHDVLGARKEGPVYFNISETDPHGHLSYCYRGKWSTIDHIIVSRSIKESCSPKFEVFKPTFLLEQDFYNNSYKPFRTYIGQKYNDGYSDHLPVKLTIAF